jgi:hypothetical protein
VNGGLRDGRSARIVHRSLHRRLRLAVLRVTQGHKQGKHEDDRRVCGMLQDCWPIAAGIAHRANQNLSLDILVPFCATAIIAQPCRRSALLALAALRHYNAMPARRVLERCKFEPTAKGKNQHRGIA